MAIANALSRGGRVYAPETNGRTGRFQTPPQFEQLEERRLLSVSGAIWTTNVDQDIVNQNQYDFKDEVYLNGGPINTNAPGMTPGEYWVQVTEPDGTVLGRSDSPNAVVPASGPEAGWLWLDHPVDGLVAYSLWDNLFQWDQGTDTFDVDGLGDKITGYADTSNPGGVYKVWAMLHDPLKPFDPETDNFRPSDSKTDNFKVAQDRDPNDPDPETVIITGYKFGDLNANGEWDGSEVGLEGWAIHLVDEDDNIVWSTITDSTGLFELEVPAELLSAGLYFLLETGQSGWVQTTLVEENGAWVDYYTISLDQDLVITILEAVTSEVDNEEVIVFGNVELQSLDGVGTIGFWSNKNGESILTDSFKTKGKPARSDGAIAEPYLAVLNDLGLHDDVDLTSYSAFRDWLLGANAKDMRYMLSAQLAAAALNQAYLLDKGVDLSGAGIYAPSLMPYLGTSSGSFAPGFFTLGDIIAGAKAALDKNPLDDRDEMEAFKDLLDMFNNGEAIMVNLP